MPSIRNDDSSKPFSFMEMSKRMYDLMPRRKVTVYVSAKCDDNGDIVKELTLTLKEWNDFAAWYKQQGKELIEARTDLSILDDSRAIKLNGNSSGG